VHNVRNYGEKLAERKKEQEERRATLSRLVGEALANPAGIAFLRLLLAELRIFEANDDMRPEMLLLEKERRRIYYQLIRPYLSYEIIQEVER
jgi:hypothetical protein